VAHFVSIEGLMIGVAVVEFGDLPKAGHATQPQC
jgi:hypothetical protein